MDEAIAWAVASLKHSTSYEFYTDLNLAAKAAEYITILSRDKYSVKVDANASSDFSPDPERPTYWVVQD